ncbi:hypothetical protein BpHYR1_020148 [Brachionus plicatilis]|uniref:Uncharacterized protein n=1 Tax=Brachionus plicatilis TaxID=10195 RepID=A0A3M7PYP5_BRAPC|nr:hypothetical protein BpHYR1_020148 [Brachionus plicatilis]
MIDTIELRNFDFKTKMNRRDSLTIMKQRNEKSKRNESGILRASNSQFDIVTQNVHQKSTLNDTTDPLVPTGSRMLLSNIYIPSQNISHSQPSSRTNLNLDSSKENQIGTVIKRKDKFFRRNILLSLMQKKTHNPLSNKPRPLCLYDFLSLFQKYYLALFTPNIEHIFDSPVNKKPNRTAQKSDRKSKRPNIQHLNVNKVKIPNEHNYKNDSELNYDEIVFTEPGQAYSQCLKMFGKMTKKMRRDFFFGEESFIFLEIFYIQLLRHDHSNLRINVNFNDHKHYKSSLVKMEDKFLLFINSIQSSFKIEDNKKKSCFRLIIYILMLNTTNN